MREAESMERMLVHSRELYERAASGAVTFTCFLTPGEQAALSRVLPREGEEWMFLGGYDAAERRRAVFLPPYMIGMEEALLRECLADTVEKALCAISVEGSGYRELSHRDYLGAILNLGVERSALGDVCPTGAHSAILFCDAVMAAFLSEHLLRVASDAVRVRPATVPPDFDGGRVFLRVTDTVASPRADAVVAALAGLSREKALALFARGAVEIDYMPSDKPDRPVREGAVVVIRGTGKFIVRSLSDKTKKGRYRLAADKYV